MTCLRVLAMLALVVVAQSSMARPAGAQSRGTQLTREALRVLVNKDVGAERWALTLNEDGTATGNVFRSDGGSPAFIFCSPILGAKAFSCVGADGCNAGGFQRGIQRTPDGRRVLINKDVGTERWAITFNGGGSVTGNVFRSDGGAPAFLSCDPLPGANQFACYGSDSCATDRCIDQYTFIANVELPAGFLEVPDPCGAAYTFIADVVLPPGFFVPVRPTLQLLSLLPDSLGAGEEAPFDVAADPSVSSVTLQFDAGRSLIQLVSLDFPSGPVTLDRTGIFDPEAPFRPYRVVGARPVAIVPVPNSPVLPLEFGSYQAVVQNLASTAAAVAGTAAFTRRANLSSGRLDVRMFFVGLHAIDAASAPGNSKTQAILDALNRKLGVAGIQLGTISFHDYPPDRATALTVVDLDRDADGNGVSDQMEEMFSLPRPMGQRTLDVFLVSEFVGSRSVIGFAGAIPGPVLIPPTVGSGVVAAVFGGSGPQDDVALAHTIVHETGHYLGLYHPTERDGAHGDPLPDTPFCGSSIETNPLTCPDLTNLMFFAIREPFADQSQLTSGQAFVLQRHPLIHDD